MCQETRRTEMLKGKLVNRIQRDWLRPSNMLGPPVTLEAIHLLRAQDSSPPTEPWLIE